MGVVRLLESLSFTQSLIFKKVNLRACICCVRVRSPISLRTPHRALTKWDECLNGISKGEKPIHLVGIDLILIKDMGSN
jgi:hypothetical protein